MGEVSGAQESRQQDLYGPDCTPDPTAIGDASLTLDAATDADTTNAIAPPPSSADNSAGSGTTGNDGNSDELLHKFANSQYYRYAFGRNRERGGCSTRQSLCCKTCLPTESQFSIVYYCTRILRLHPFKTKKRNCSSYTAAFGVTVGVGCLLLILNIVIFAGIYYQRERLRRKSRGTRSGAAAAAAASTTTANNGHHHHHHHHQTASGMMPIDADDVDDDDNDVEVGNVSQHNNDLHHGGGAGGGKCLCHLALSLLLSLLAGAETLDSVEMGNGHEKFEVLVGLLTVLMGDVWGNCNT